jgi:very-short-patch-repair endonuclease
MKSNNERQQQLTAKYFEALSKGARPSTYKFAGALRKSSTQAETLLWSKLRNRKLKGKKFRRQHPLSKYVLDFYCHECKLDVELDGYHHKKMKQREYDEERTRMLNEFGITVLRFWNNDVIKNTQKVLDKIAEYVN